MPDQGPEPTPEPGDDDDDKPDDKHDVYKDTPQGGYVPTYFDGHGGIAGVPLTDEQRKAVIAEAERRGMSEPDAKALAYGEPEHAPQAPPSGTGVLVAVKTLYREVAPGETTTTTVAGSAPSAPAPPAASEPKTTAPAPPPGGKNESKEDEPKKGTDAPKPRSATEDAKQMIKDIVPDPVEDLLRHMTHLRSFMRGVSAPGVEPTVEVTTLDDSTGAVTMSTVMSDSMEVSVTVTTPTDEAAPSQPCTVSVTVTDTQTGDVAATSEPKTVDSPQDVTHVAINEVVDTVIAASSEDTAQAPPEMAATARTPEGGVPTDPEGASTVAGPGEAGDYETLQVPGPNSILTSDASAPLSGLTKKPSS
ncbi:hypothetical protein AB0D63_20660 [Kitasatospora sp. NPDC048343]|uniref:hypothetical protein n=1 Tax=Kitasatospora sp. NPDC048343 TaxID=3154717 RepID=UPI0033CE530E